MTATAKQFKLSVRVKEESVDQVPALAFSWFDPKQEQFLTSRSKPIALQVMPAQIISTADVVAVAPVSPTEEFDEAGSNTSTALSFVGANLAIETDAARSLIDSRTAISSRVVVAGMYLSGFVVLIIAVVIHCRRQIDPHIIIKRNRLKAWKQQLSSAKSLSPPEAARQVAETLRQMLSGCASDQRREVNELTSACENYIYDQSGTQKPFDLALIDRALELTNQIP